MCKQYNEEKVPQENASPDAQAASDKQTNQTGIQESNSGSYF